MKFNNTISTKPTNLRRRVSAPNWRVNPAQPDPFAYDRVKRPMKVKVSLPKVSIQKGKP